ncbi:pyridoxal phosphate-dependent aminotransferase [Streptomyces sasae]|uniref:pyridoxal phosphate-dependent aminotransferase n=1 Tax=Streptomyces sasae TaxID=1266772 RepID=UPI00292E4481|nr:pyridoxal phosphate-dependent aminotransferase [Streptomyces sasae]
MTSWPDLLERSVSPNKLPDTVWLDRFLARADGLEPILLGLGERWDGTPAALLAGLAAAPPSSHGYQLSMYGLPRLRAVLRNYLRDTHRLAGFDDAFEVAVSWTGTRSVMRDFGELVAARSDGGRPLSALAVAPSWDYAGILEPAGFQMRYLDPTAAGRWEPTPDLVADFAVTLPKRLDLVVINAQHNPTGLSWTSDTVRALIRLAADHEAAVLIDDAYYGFLDPVDEPTSAFLELLSEPAASGLPWLAVRSLGKQFNCNGWAIGAMAGPPVLLDDLVNEVRSRHTYNHGAHLQSAMADWLADRDAVSVFLAEERARYAARRGAAVKGLTNAGVTEIVAGPAGPYLLYPVPADRAADRMSYLETCAVEAGVLMSDAWPAARLLAPRAGRHIRMYLGRDPETITEACARLAAAGLIG